MKKKAVFSWSTGKDSTLALHKILNQNEFEIVSLITTVTEDYGRVSYPENRSLGKTHPPPI